MITGAEVMGRLAEACPSWAVAHPAVQRPVDAPAVVGERDYEPLAAFAHHLVDLAEDGRAEEFPAVFGVVEQVLQQGDDDAVALVRTGLLEDLQNITSHRDVRVNPDDLRALLPPSAASVWDELDEAWTAATAQPDSRARRSPVEDYLDLGPTDRRRVQSMTRELPDGTLAAPSDILRYEAGQYDEELGRWLRVMRVGPAAVLLLAAVAIVAAYLLIR